MWHQRSGSTPAVRSQTCGSPRPDRSASCGAVARAHARTHWSPSWPPRRWRPDAGPRPRPRPPRSPRRRARPPRPPRRAAARRRRPWPISLPPSSPGRRHFPSATGKSLKDLGTLAKSSVQLGAATGTFTPGTNRFAFALTTNAGAFVYAPTRHLRRHQPGLARQGPVPGSGRSDERAASVPQQAERRARRDPGDLRGQRAAAQGRHLLRARRSPRRASGLIGAPGEIAVAASSPIPDVGQRPPDIATDTLATVHGNVSLLTTRLPPETWRRRRFNQVLGKKPVALLFSTPQLCISRVCGPVTDIAVQLQHQFGNKVDVHPPGGLRGQPAEQGPAPAAQGVPPAHRAVAVRHQPPGHDRRPARGGVRHQRADPGASRPRCDEARASRRGARRWRSRWRSP